MMTKQYQPQVRQDYISNQIQQAFGVLKFSFATVPELFPGRELCVINSQNDGIKSRMLEVSFDKATLTCHFNKDDICHTAYLYLEDLGDLQRYVDYFNQTYKSDSTCQAWVSNKGYICLEADGMDCYLALRSFDV